MFEGDISVTQRSVTVLTLVYKDNFVETIYYIIALLARFASISTYLVKLVALREYPAHIFEL